MPANDAMMEKGFLERLAEMLSMDEAEVKEKVEALDGAALIDLSDAVFRDDTDAVTQIMGGASSGDADEGFESELDDIDSVDGFDGDIGDLLLPADDADDEEEDKSEVEDEQDDETLAPVDEDATSAQGALAIGDRVRVGNAKGIVHIPDGPGMTVGVLIGGKLRMLDRSKIVRESFVNGGVMGMVSTPDIARMQELAGIMVTQRSASPQPAFPDSASSVEITAVGNCDDAQDKAAAALADLEACLPQLKISEWPPIRKRLYSMIGALNERAEQAGRRRKL